MSTDPSFFLEHLYKKQKRAFSYLPENDQAWQGWSAGLRRAITDQIGLDRIPASPDGLQPERLESVDCATYIRELYTLQIAPELTSLAYVLIPKLENNQLPDQNTKVPAILACHGHGYGVRDIVGLEADGSPRKGDSGYHKDFALSLVQRGFIVVAPEIIGFGQARREQEIKGDPGESSCYPLSTGLMMFGVTMAGLRVFQAQRLLDYMNSRPDINADRIGCMGISGGGLVAAFTSALDDRITATVISGYVNTFKDCILSVHHCVDNYVPGILRFCEMPDLVRLIAPRPLLIESGLEDPIFPIQAAKKAAENILDMYKFFHAQQCLETDFFAGDHQIHGEKAYPWLQRWLTKEQKH